MNLESRIRSDKIVGLWFLTNIYFVLVLIAVPNGIAAPMETSTTILSDVGAIGPDNTIQFSIWVFTGFNPVPTGPIQITDTNTSESIDSTILAGKATINWTVTDPFIEGIHIFEAEFQGFLDYSPSSGICLINFDDFSSGSTITTAIDLSSNSTVVYKNSSIRFTVKLEILNSVQPYFKGGYIYVKNKDLNGTPTIYTYGPLPLIPSAVLTFSFDYKIPVFTSVGINSFLAQYTGSSQSQTKFCTSSLQNVTVLSTGFWLVQTLDQNALQREEGTLELNTTVLGDNPIGLELKTYYYLDEKEVIIDKRFLISRNLITYFSPNSSIPIGVLSIFTILIDPSTELQYANSIEEVSIIDRARIAHSENSTVYRHNETIRFEIYVTEEDVWTHPVVSKVELMDVTENNRSLINKTTNQDGFVIIEYPIPHNLTVGSHEFSLQTHDTNEFILGNMEIFPIIIKGLTEIDLTYEVGGVVRNAITIIQVTVLSGDSPINEGRVSLEFSANSSIIETKSCEPGLEFYYHIKISHPRGVTNYQVRFFDSSNYDEHVESFFLTVFANPMFNTTGTNGSEVIKGHTVRIWGKLCDELSHPLIYEEIILTDNTIGMFIGTSETNDQGIFFYDYEISDSTQIGVHFVEVTYLGNILKYYHPSINSPVVSFIVRPSLSIMVETEVLANHWTNISLEGGLQDIVELQWQKNGESSWNHITSVELSSSGQGFYNWSTPYYKGDFTIRAIGPKSTKYDFSSMYAIPEIIILGDKKGNVNDPYPFTVNSSEQFQIWIEDQLWQDWNQAGIHQYECVFPYRGLKEITIISNETYVYYHEFHHVVKVYEELFVFLYAPLEVMTNITFNLDGTVIGEVSGPTQGIDATLEVNGTRLQVDATDGAGRYYFSFAISNPGYYGLVVRTAVSETDFYNSASSEESILLINSIPANIEIISPKNQTYGSIVEVSIIGDAKDYWYRIEPKDQTNTSWTAPIYRNLPEGSFKCHVYGINDYGVVSYVWSTFTVDTTAPSLILINPTNTTYTTNDILISYITDETEVSIFLDGSELEKIETETLLTDLKEGTHNLTIVAGDKVGNNVTSLAIFTIDTITPSLEIYSPYNQRYIGGVEIIIGSNASTILYSISQVHAFNHTYTQPLLLNLSIGYYTLNVYAFDDAGNCNTESITFSIVQPIDLLINSGWEIIDDAGNYLVYTQILNHPNFDIIGIFLNGTYFDNLEWSIIHQDYRTTFQLETPGVWQLTLSANTTLTEYDFQYFIIEWAPPPPVFESISISFDSSSYGVRVYIDSGTLPLDTVQVSYNNVTYNLTEYYGNRWETSLPFYPQNTTTIFFIWYPWDKNPSTVQEFDIHWYAPSIIAEYNPTRTNFSLIVQIERQNASIDTSSVELTISNGYNQIKVNETSFYEYIAGDYQEWEFTSPNLQPGIWTYTIVASDSQGVERVIRGLFNASDTPPRFKVEEVILIARYTTGELWRVEVAVNDDYSVENVILFVDGIELAAVSQNGTHFIFEIWLKEGTHSLQLVAYDDIQQETFKYLPSITVEIDDLDVSTKTPDTSAVLTSLPNDDSLGSKETEGINELFELGFAGSIFAAFVAVGKILTKKK
ncbi:MAG: hypothetical protein ACFFCU_08855 [Promethearchaeota archaeon]